MTIILNYLCLAHVFFSGLGEAPQQRNTAVKDSAAIVDEMRISFFLGAENESELAKLENLIQTNFGKDEKNYAPKILAYAGGLDALKAKHAFNPFRKLSCILSGVEKLDKAVKKNPENLEIRFLRFVILDNLPGVLGIGAERDADINKICSLLLEQDYTELNKGVQQIIAEYMFESKRLSGKQKNSISKIFPELTL